MEKNIPEKSFIDHKTKHKIRVEQPNFSYTYQSRFVQNLYGFHNLSSLFLNEFNVGADTTCSGSLFHAFVTLLLKKCWRHNFWDLCFFNLNISPSGRAFLFEELRLSVVRMRHIFVTLYNIASGPPII